MRFIFLFPLVFLLCSCSSLFGPRHDSGPSHYVDVSAIPNAVPRPLPRSKSGNKSPYTVLGIKYYIIKSPKGYKARGIASWYGTKFNGKLTASGEPYNMLAMTAANKVLPIPCFVRVTDLVNHRQVIVKVNDRGPFAPNRIIDLSYAAAAKLHMLKHGTALVEIEVVNQHSPDLRGNISPIATPHHAQLYLQVGAFDQLNHAKALEQKLHHLIKQPVKLQQHGHWYKVQVGPLKQDVSLTDALKKTLSQHGIKTYTVIY